MFKPYLLWPKAIHSIWSDLGTVLLVGEGNFSFAKSLLKQPNVKFESMIPTTIDAISQISTDTILNIKCLEVNGIKPLFKIDAVKLEKHFSPKSFDTIIFQFPNVGSRIPKYGQHPNHIMIRKFLKSSRYCLKDNGHIYVSTVDTPQYAGQFNLENAAKFADVRIKNKTYFNPNSFRFYEHENTKNDESALEKYDKFITWIFSKNH